jgi:hypothetical protein
VAEVGTGAGDPLARGPLWVTLSATRADRGAAEPSTTADV